MLQGSLKCLYMLGIDITIANLVASEFAEVPTGTVRFLTMLPEIKPLGQTAFNKK